MGQSNIPVKRTDFMDFVLEFHNTMLENRLTLVYEGEVNQSITKAFAALAEKNMNEDKETKKVSKTVYHVMVECLQNIYKHADHEETGLPFKPGNGIFLVGQDDEGYIITTGNVIASDKVPVIRGLIEDVNDKSMDEIKEMYKKQMREGRLSEKGGAGLGFIDIAKKTGNKLDYRFTEINELTSFFILKTRINRTVNS